MRQLASDTMSLSIVYTTHIKIPANISSDLGVHHINLLILSEEFSQRLWFDFLLRYHHRICSPGRSLSLGKWTIGIELVINRHIIIDNVLKREKK